MSTWLDFAPDPRPLSADEAWTVFLSYRSINRLWALNLYDALTAAGHKVFLDETVLKAGDRLRQTIRKALANSQAGVLVWSKEARTSQWVADEYDTMLDLADEKEGFCFAPLKISKHDLPKFVDLKKFIDFTAYPDGPNGVALMRLLFAVVDKPLSKEALRYATEYEEEARDISNTISALRDLGKTDQLRKLADVGGRCWEDLSNLADQTIGALAKIGAYDDAIEVAEQYEKRFKKAIRIKQMKALALARRAEKQNRREDLDEAQLILAKLYVDGHRDPETVGIYARTYMDLFEVEKSRLHLERSRELYNDAFQADREDYYVGINAAAKSVLLATSADLELASRLADRVAEIVGTEPVVGDYWKTATVAEVQLIKQNYKQAAELYRKAVLFAPNETGSHDSTRNQAARLMIAMNTPDEVRTRILDAFSHLEEQ